MRTKRQMVKSPSDACHSAARKKGRRVEKVSSNQKENVAPSLSINNEVQKHEPSPRRNVSSTEVRVKEDKKTGSPLNESTNAVTNAPADQILDDVGPRKEDVLQRNGALEVLSGCLYELEQVKEESTHHTEDSPTNQSPVDVEDVLGVHEAFNVWDDELENQPFPCYESDTEPEVYQQATKDEENSSLEGASNSNQKDAKLAIFTRAQPNASSFHGNLKLYRFMMCEWFYSHIDEALFSTEDNRNKSFNSLLRQCYPQLHTRVLNRAQWAHIRKELGKLTRMRRLSPAFLLQERIALERRREKVRFLMENPMIEYLDDDIPSIIPRGIEVGSMVRAALLAPRYGCFPGEVVGIEHKETPSYRIRFQIDGTVHEQLLPDYRVALQQALLVAEPSGVLSVSVKHLKQVVQLEEYAHKKRHLLYELDNIRLNTEARRSMGLPITARDYEQSQRYEQLIEKLLNMNRTHLPVMKHVATDYEQYMSEPLTTGSDVTVVDRYVIDVVDQLMKEYAKLDHIQNNPIADRLWEEAMNRLRKKPEHMKQLDHYLTKNIGTKYNVTAFSPVP